MATQPERSPAAKEAAGGNLYASAGEALKKVATEYEYWSGKLTETSLQMCYSLIGANWAVFGSFNGILSNNWSKWSLFMVVAALASNIVGAWLLSESLRSRVLYGESDSARWEREYQAACSSAGAWPFSESMDIVGRAMRIVKGSCTLAAACLFIIGAVLK